MELSFTNPMVFAAPAFIAFIVIELRQWKANGPKDLYKWSDLRASSLVALGTAILGPLTKVTFSYVIFTAAYEYFNPLIDGVRTNIMGYESFGYAWYIWILCQLADDFTFYWYHRISHTVRFFWASHIPHHSSEYYNYGTAIRIGWFVLFIKPFFYVWMAAVGFPVEMMFISLALETIYQFQLHTRFVPKLGIIEKIFVTHTQHQVHHGRNIQYLDKNHGGILCIWDRMFGSFQEYDDDVEIEYGILNKQVSFNPFDIVTHEYRSIWQDVKKANTWRERFMYLFGPPGWSPDGSTKTTKQLQEMLKIEQAKAVVNG